MKKMGIKSTIALVNMLTIGGCSLVNNPPPDGPDAGPTADPPSIIDFAIDQDLVTYGPNQADVLIRGSVNIAFDVSGAEWAALYYDEEQIVRCEQDDCREQTTAHQPVRSGEYRLVAASDEAECTFDTDGTPTDPDRCVVRELAIETVFPAGLELTGTPLQPVAGEAVTIDYSVERATGFEIGVITLVGGERTFEACSAAGTDPAAPCHLPDVGGGTPDIGSIIFDDVTSSFTVGGRATGLAPDGLGNIADGDVEVTINVLGAPAVEELTLADATLAPGGSIEISFSTENATAIEITAQPNNVEPSDLALCANALSEQGEGNCMVRIAEGAPYEPIVISAVATHPQNGSSAPKSASVDVGALPDLTVSAAPAELPEGGGETTVTWQSTGALNLSIFDAADPDTPLLDVATDTGTDRCLQGCLLSGDGATFSVGITTSFFTRAENDYGFSSGSSTVSVEGSPSVTALSASGQDLLTEPDLVLDGPDLTVDYDTANAGTTTIERADAPPGGCDPGLELGIIEEHDGAQSGALALTGIDRATCFRLTAEGGAGQSSSVMFRVVRVPEIASAVALDNTINHDQPLELTLSAENASSMTLGVAPAGAISDDDLAACSSLDAMGELSCSFGIQPGTPLGTVTISAQAHGQLDTISALATVDVTLGEAPTALSFGANPAVLAAAGDVTLSWTSEDATAVTVFDDEANVLYTTEVAAEVAAGSITQTVMASTSFRLLVENLYGIDEHEVTVFLGPSFDALDVGQDDALDGLASQSTGPSSIDWSTTNADSVTLRATLGAPGSGCVDEDAAAFAEELGSGGATGSAAIADLITDRCIEAIAQNQAGQSSRVVFLLKDLPGVIDVGAMPSTLAPEGGTILISSTVRGAESVSVDAVYLDNTDMVISTRNVCDEGSLNTGSVADDSESRSFTCDDSYDDPNDLICQTPGVCRTVPAGTARISYQVVVVDQEADQAVGATSNNEQVTVE